MIIFFIIYLHIFFNIKIPICWVSLSRNILLLKTYEFNFLRYYY
jgi:hypothetical protein